MKDRILKTFTSTIKSIDEKNHTIDALISNETKDRDGEIILRTAWINGLLEYLKHPILLSSHSYHKLTFQIGKAIDVKVTAEGLVAKFQYFVGAGNPEADWAFTLAKEGIAAYSVGFRAKDWIEGDYNAGVGRVFTDVELMEVSQVLIPSNPDALQRNSKDPVEKQLTEMAIKHFKWEKKEEPPAIVLPEPPVSSTLPAQPEMMQYDPEKHKVMIMDCMRAAWAEYMPQIEACIKDTINSCLVVHDEPNGGKHYSKLLFSKKDQRTIVPESTVAEVTKTTVENLKKLFQK